MSELQLPLLVTSGYPPKEYMFSGKWERQEMGRKKSRRKIIYIPVYEFDGQKILPMWLAQKKVPDSVSFVLEGEMPI